jgi:hypothetical protein
MSGKHDQSFPMAKQPDLEVADTSGLMDSDWSEINKIQRAYNNGPEALSWALEELQKKDPMRVFKVIGAFFPDMLRETIKDKMAEDGMTKEDLRELIRSSESPAHNQ